MHFSQSIRGYLGGNGARDTEFMPEVQGTLLEDSPNATRITLWAALGLLVAAITWAYFADIEEVTKGEGKAIPSSKVQTIQNLEGGIVSEIFVREGQVVNKGQPLLRLDDTRFSSNKGETEADRNSLEARVERLSAEAEGREPAFTDALKKDAPQVVEDQLALYQTRMQRQNSELNILQEQLRQKAQELQEFRAKTQQYRSSLGLVQQEINMSEPLVKAGAVSPVELLRLRRSAVEISGDLNATNLAIPRAEAAVNEIQRKVEESKLGFRSDALKELNDVRTDLNKLTATSRAIDDKVNRTLVVAPLRGIVKQLKVNTIGGVVQPGNDMVEIVPLEDNLLVEARVRPQDIAFLHPGQPATVKFTAYDYTIYGGLKAKLEVISADTITDDKGNSFYMIQVRTDKNHLGTDAKPLLIIPGMVATVDIITGEKSVLDYILKPVLKARWEALRER
ncbi:MULTISPECIES: HlyD family type I secretion periplasmic adaptor subunit [Pseudomonadaceae]|uniref:Membrane fusion protein (MFP) family protein n=2 Tax=Pseudomonadaceae TaxID=135621 RepID=A0A5R9AIC7_PSENT|nr:MULTISPECIES: HlyD family type I secretion periplasmic adaptor subunit [Pseudomonadaceae]OQR31441.1 hemolysin secretion protein D [Pseudomonas sp. T]MBD9512575.1 HlyD family type I secretion periplasmic adaptor subunit [Pseudomonas sp. PDM22]MBD9630908.1 HlyD family type I secretion periplasmic adaptor subunit [Pseudomonas sp. PDM19]QEY72827.1 HlyD family type I secretion periplasmic adaptor subunit [Pseudomonas denitrificans (nom. rej.)]TLP78502.1 HlyD family type I secretion periplasmic a